MTKIDLSLENNTHLLEQKDQSQEMFRGNFLNLHRDTVKMPNGSLATRDYFAHPGAAVHRCRDCAPTDSTRDCRRAPR